MSNTFVIYFPSSFGSIRIPSTYTSFNVVFYSNHKEDVYVSQEAISNIFLKSHTCEDYYELNIKNVKEINNSIEYNDKTYYEKVLGLNLPLEVNEDYQVNDCYLEINYLSKEFSSSKKSIILIITIITHDKIICKYDFAYNILYLFFLGGLYAIRRLCSVVDVIIPCPVSCGTFNCYHCFGNNVRFLFIN